MPNDHTRTVRTKFCSVCLLAICVVLPGCMMHTVISSASYYPPSANRSQDAEFSVVVSSHGAPGKAYPDRTKKQVYVYLLRRDVQKLSTNFKVEAADLDWEVLWRSPVEPILHFYDLPDGVSTYDKGSKASRREILTKHYRYDAKTGLFIELSQ